VLFLKKCIGSVFFYCNLGNVDCEMDFLEMMVGSSFNLETTGKKDIVGVWVLEDEIQSHGF